MRITQLILLLAMPLTLMSQKDPEAVMVLSEFSKRALAAPSVSIDYELVAYDAIEEDETTLDGRAVISGDSYRLTLPDNLIWADGRSVWNYMPDINEVTITEADTGDDSFISRPSLLFSMHEAGYKVRLLSQDNREWVIDLYPENIKVNMIRIRLTISKVSYDLKSAVYQTRDGITLTLTPKKYDLTFVPPPGYFIFKSADHKGIEVVDMR